jgi:hypothetical protein
MKLACWAWCGLACFFFQSWAFCISGNSGNSVTRGLEPNYPRVFRVLRYWNRTRNQTRSVRVFRFGYRVIRFGFGNSVFRAQSDLPSPSRRRRQRHRLHLAPPCPCIADASAPGVAPLPRLGGRGQVFVRPFARLHFAGEENHKVCQSLLFPSCCAKRSTQTLLS